MGLKEAIIYSSPDDTRQNRGFCFLEYESHKAASHAKQRLETGRIKVWSCDIIVDWADPQEEPDEAIMAQVRLFGKQSVLLTTLLASNYTCFFDCIILVTKPVLISEFRCEFCTCAT